jgi:hypothetical protein
MRTGNDDAAQRARLRQEAAITRIADLDLALIDAEATGDPVVEIAPLGAQRVERAAGLDDEQRPGIGRERGVGGCRGGEGGTSGSHPPIMPQCGGASAFGAAWPGVAPSHGWATQRRPKKESTAAMTTTRPTM